ncbi:hypothetical protein KIH74_32625 [Kineosporia sp. J2-2]|uniref:histidine kinase n=1 Tax=Kineosporia corallincola TaxID=2835133 RepID=A0ABS5TSH3_9ACTN|nr:ATP-binding protein [Kineosporia corallincola]MBT0773736.1 hypothetical protein [Kineosporia corallincola]
MVQSLAGDTEVVPGAAPRLIPAGQPGVQAAAVLSLGRAILVARLILSFLYAVTAVLLSGADAQSLQRYAVPLAIIAAVTSTELATLRRMANGPPRVLLVLADSAVALVLFLVWTGDPVYVVYQIGAAALAGAMLGLHGAPLWLGQAVQAAATCWFVLADKVAPLATTVVLVTAPALILAAGASSITLAQLIRDRLNRDLDPSVPVAVIHDAVSTTLRRSCLAWFRLPRFGRRTSSGPGPLADELARLLTQDTLTALEQAEIPVGGVRFDYSHEDFADSLDALCHEWAASTNIHLRTDLPPVWLRVPVRHQLALIVDDALTNVSEHAHATRAQVELTERRQGVTITVKDNGQGFVVPSDPATLRGGDYDGICRMISRSSYLGANLTITTAPYSGTEIRVRLEGKR